jgi:transposase InsO family protein
MSAGSLRYERRPDRKAQLRQSGQLVNYKRVERLYRLEKLQVRRRRRKKIPVAERSIGGSHLTRNLDEVCAKRGKPAVIRTDNGPEFIGKGMLNRSFRMGVQLKLIEPGRPNQNAYFVSFNGRLRKSV